MADYTTIDFFSDTSLVDDPYPYFDELRNAGPVIPLPSGVVAVTGFEEANEVYFDAVNFSSCNSVVGPFAQFPVPLEGDDVGPIIDQYRDHLPMYEHMVTMDPPDHTRERALLMRLITSRRLRENEAFMLGLSDRLLDEFIADGKCEFIGAYSKPFALLVVADLLGVPESEHERFRAGFGATGNPGAVGDETGGSDAEDLNFLGWLDKYFADYVEDRRREPRDDVLTDLAQATYPDGSVPDVTNVVRTATFLFAAGQETTAKLLAVALRYLAEQPELQDRLRQNKDLIPSFIEESLRIESPVKADFRLAKRATKVGGVDIAPGTPVMLLNGAANRDPRRFACPAEFQADRSNSRAHMAFGRGNHTCPGAPLARTEGRISLERILDRVRDIRLSEEHHGPPGDRVFHYEPTWVLRGMTELHLEFSPVEGAR